MTKGDKARVAGVGMIPFSKPGTSGSWDEMGAAAARLALEDAGLTYADIAQAFVGYVYGDSTAGQAALYELGLTGVPIINVNNNCSTGSTALFLARQAVESGVVDVAFALGFEQMNPGPLRAVFTDRKRTLGRFRQRADELLPPDDTIPLPIRYFAAAGREHQERFGSRAETFAGFAAKARRHARENPMAVLREPLSIEEIVDAPVLSDPLTRLQACPPTCGAAAAVVVSPGFARSRGLTSLVEIVAQALTTDRESTFESMVSMVGADIAREAAAAVYEASGAGPEDVQVVELHDCFTTAEAIFSEALGLCPEGGAEEYVLTGSNTYGGKHVVNPSGGLLAKGHPLGATGLAQCFELVNQVRGRAGPRQVEGVKNALQHNSGLGSACVVTMYRQA